MKMIRFDRGRRPEVEKSTKPLPPRIREPLTKKIIQAGLLFALLMSFGYWFASILAFRQYKGIVVGDQATLTSAETGSVEELFKGQHHPFRAGDPLMRIANPSLRLRLEALDQAVSLLESGALANEAAELSQMQAKWDLAKAAADAAQAERESAQERASASRDLLQRSERLRAEGAVTQATIESRARDLRAAEASLASAAQKLVEARQAASFAAAEYERALQIGSRQKRYDRANILEKKAERDTLRQRVESLTLRAAANGIVAHIVKWRGDSVQAGEPLVQVFYEGQFTVDAYIDPEDRLAVPVGSEVKINTGGPLRVPLTGRVISLSPVTHSLPATHREVIAQVEQFIVARVTIDLKEALDAGLSPGQLVKVQIPRW